MALLDAALAQRFIDKMGKYLEYNINVMNENGIIIASRDENRIGDFHEVANGMLNGTLNTGVVDEEKKFIGTKPGVNLFIEHKAKPVGVICVTGNPESVKSFAGLVKVSLEAMLEYELYMERKRSRRNKSEQFLYYLLFEENPDLTVLNSLADEIELDKELMRTAIVIKVQKNYDTQSMLKSISLSKGYTHTDLVVVASNDNIVILKSVKTKGITDMSDYRYNMEEFIEDFLTRIPDGLHSSDFSFYVGSLQNKLDMYRKSYIHAQEIFLHTKYKEGINFFDDYIVDYFRSIVTMKEFDDIFNVYNQVFTEDERQMIAETVQVLSNNNYNVVNSAKELFMHRNTLVFRLNKIKNTLNIDPIANAADREFLNELAYYFRNK
ncbi:CdaR family transcriptional regulator [Alkalibacter saccharofermentans]|uniref:Carbohydrate diacid regulator n=1 Tax=Alkalibacter saccharofermentans DSM 14828 TaxID=1120975 RepID=A0A1M4WFW0_9FIRM|nr:sugar diacid recognition domain-containing protein [Alkalibacter saccharofermentans]SHE80040.1 carbohydrate diacid regulator [Alkalibacter saccharofermentans DSM 14828]